MASLSFNVLCPSLFKRKISTEYFRMLITIVGHNQANRDRNVASFIDAIQRRKFTLNESKIISSAKSLNILSYIVGNIKITPDPEGMRALHDFPVPNDKNALRPVLGMFT